MRESEAAMEECAASSIKPFVLPQSYPHYAPDRPLELRHIRIKLTPNFETEEILGEALLRLSSKRDGITELKLDVADLEVDYVSLGTDRVPYEHQGERLIAHLPSPTKIDDQIEVLVGYHGHPRKGLYFRKPTKERPNRPLQLWTQGEDELSHYWFPCIDAPAQKVSSEVIATVPERMTAISNGKLVSVVEDKEKGTKTYHWSQEKPHSVYLISLVVGEYVLLQEDVDGVPLLYYVYPGREEDARRSFSETPKMVKFFEEKTGMKYPWDKYAQVVVNDFIFGGMENTSATTLTDTTLHDERAHADYSSVPLVAHELAHMWFGDLLTCRHWSHAWLNESFATFFEKLYQEHSRGKDEYVYALMDDLSVYLDEYEKHYARPIVTNYYENPSEIFDRHLYQKGCLVLNMLRFKLGDRDFFRSIQRYVRDNAFGVVETTDLARAVERTTGINLDGFFEQWLYRPGHPELSVSLSGMDSSGVMVRVKQNQDSDAFRLDLKIRIDYGDGVDERYLRVEGKDQSFYIPFNRKPIYISIDPDFSILGTIQFERPVEMMVAQLEKDGVAGRISAAKGLAKDGSSTSVKHLERSLLSDPFWGVRVECAKALGEIGNEAAKVALLDCIDAEHPKVRRAVVQALGKIKSDDVASVLASRLEKGDSSYFVEGELARSLGKMKNEQYEQVIIKAMSRPSFNETIQVGAIEGLANLDKETVVNLIIERTGKNFPPQVRQAATAALGKLGYTNRRVKDLLVELLRDEWFRVRSAAAQAIVERKDTDAAKDIEAALASEVDGRVRRSFYEALNSLRSQTPSDELRQLRNDLEKVRDENRLIKERLERLEGMLRSSRTRGKRSK